VEHPVEPGVAAEAWRDLGRVVAAHVVMLRDEAILDDAGAAAVLTALDGVRRGEPPAAPSLAALIAAFDRRLDAQVPAGVAGAAAIGRARADMLATLVRLATRGRLLAAAERLEALRDALLELAGAHAVTLMPAFSEGQPAQPTTLGHYLGGVIAPLGRAGARLRGVYAEVNRSPLGAAALAGPGFAVSRERVAALLGCDGPVPNTFDAVAAGDELAAAAALVGGVAATVGRFVEELLRWLRVEPTSVRLGDEWLGGEPALPHLRPPVGLHDLAVAARQIAADGMALVAFAQAAPYEPLIATNEAIYAPLGRLLDRGAALLTRATGLISTGLDVNRAYLANRSGRALTTTSDLADFLMVEEQLAPAAARNIAALTVSRAAAQGLEAGGITPELVGAAALTVIGRELGIEFETLGRFLAPRRFVERRTATGAASPAATRAYLELERARLAADVAWREDALARLAQADADLARQTEGMGVADSG